MENISESFCETEGASLVSRLETLMRGNISSGAWKEGECLPPEVEIAVQCGVSRNTVRTAIMRLAAEGWLTRSRGKGTFVSRPRISVPQGMPSIKDFVSARMQVPVFRIVREGTAIQPSWINALFGIEPEEPLYCIGYARFGSEASARPAACHYTWVLKEYCLRQDCGEVSHKGMEELLRLKFGLVSARTTQYVKAEGASEADADILKIPKGSPVLTIQENRYDDDGRMFALFRLVIPGELMYLEF